MGFGSDVELGTTGERAEHRHDSVDSRHEVDEFGDVDIQKVEIETSK